MQHAKLVDISKKKRERETENIWKAKLNNLKQTLRPRTLYSCTEASMNTGKDYNSTTNSVRIKNVLCL